MYPFMHREFYLPKYFQDNCDFRFNPKIKEINMMHAFDCTKLSLRQLQDKVHDAKRKDEKLRKTIQ